MKFLKSVWRIISLVIIIFLACVGVALAGGVPVTMNRKRQDDEIQIVMVESREGKNDFTYEKDVKQ
jgi:hypothetical protein